MAHTVDSVSLAGLRKAHLRQLAAYIRHRDHDEWYYGCRRHFESRHRDLKEFADRLERIADDGDARLPKKQEVSDG